MAIDLELMRRKLEGKTTPKGFVKFKKGETVVRVAPADDGDPFKTYFFHYGVGDSPGFLCPKKNFNESCPVCDFASQLWREGTDESRVMAKALFVRERHFSPVLVRGEEKEGIRFWAYGKEVYEYLIGLCLNPDYGDITDLDTGTDIVVTVSQPEGQRFPKTTCQPKRKSSKFCDSMDKKTCTEVLKSAPVLTDLMVRKTPEEVQGLLAKVWLNEEGGKESAGKPDKEKFGGSEGKKSDEPVAVEEALNELLGDS